MGTVRIGRPPSSRPSTPPHPALLRALAAIGSGLLWGLGLGLGLTAWVTLADLLSR